MHELEPHLHEHEPHLHEHVVVAKNLRAVINCNGPLDERWARFYAAELVVIIDEKHRQGMCLMNFGLDNVYVQADGHINVSINPVTYNEGKVMTQGEYVPIDVMTYQFIDWTMLGVCLFNMLTGQTPFYDCSSFYPPDLDVNSQSLAHVSKDAQTLVMTLLSWQHDRWRLGVTGYASDVIMAHSFFNDVNWHDVRSKQVLPPHLLEVAADARSDVHSHQQGDNARDVTSFLCS